MMVASTGLVLGHNEYTPLSQFEPADSNHIVAAGDLLVDPVLMEGYELVAYTQAVKQAAYLGEADQREALGRGSALPAGGSANYIRVDRDEPLVKGSFREGWRSAGGVEAWLDFVVDVVVTCESSWDPNVVSPNGLYRGLGQWDWPTWNDIAALTGYSDIWSPFDQGFNIAYKSRRDGGFAWPGCWETRWN